MDKRRNQTPRFFQSRCKEARNEYVCIYNVCVVSQEQIQQENGKESNLSPYPERYAEEEIGEEDAI